MCYPTATSYSSCTRRATQPSNACRSTCCASLTPLTPWSDRRRATRRWCSASARRGKRPRTFLHQPAGGGPALYPPYRARRNGGHLEDREFRLYLDFLHMLGAITHSNAAGLENLVIIDPLWLLRQKTAIRAAPVALRPSAGGCAVRRLVHTWHFETRDHSSAVGGEQPASVAAPAGSDGARR